ncbi:hypothetical protein ILUMI_11786 [Ignelater luminosus]|uniref:Uncharacterized protein n=1 Tax=Ignelater luminosus TaxID=2038154 RepID=A0A8K0GDK5_IGNLU|nr:hypothetical protein ILUMI_11786 [Ignelater luminosus]
MDEEKETRTGVPNKSLTPSGVDNVITSETNQSSKTAECSESTSKDNIEVPQSHTNETTSKQSEDPSLEENELNISVGSDSSNKENQEQVGTDIKENRNVDTMKDQKDSLNVIKEVNTSQQLKNQKSAVTAKVVDEPMETEEFPEDYDFSGKKDISATSSKSLEIRTCEIEQTKDVLKPNVLPDKTGKPSDDHLEVKQEPKVSTSPIIKKSTALILKDNNTPNKMDASASTLASPRRSPRLISHSKNENEQKDTTPSKKPAKLKLDKELDVDEQDSAKKIDIQTETKDSDVDDKEAKETDAIKQDKVQKTDVQTEIKNFSVDDEKVKKTDAVEELTSDIEFIESEPSLTEDKIKESDKSADLQEETLDSSMKSENDSSPLLIVEDDTTKGSNEKLTSDTLIKESKSNIEEKKKIEEKQNIEESIVEEDSDKSQTQKIISSGEEDNQVAVSKRETRRSTRKSGINLEEKNIEKVDHPEEHSEDENALQLQKDEHQKRKSKAVEEENDKSQTQKIINSEGEDNEVTVSRRESQRSTRKSCINLEKKNIEKVEDHSEGDSEAISTDENALQSQKDEHQKRESKAGNESNFEEKNTENVKDDSLEIISSVDVNRSEFQTEKKKYEKRWTVLGIESNSEKARQRSSFKDKEDKNTKREEQEILNVENDSEEQNVKQVVNADEDKSLTEEKSKESKIEEKGKEQINDSEQESIEINLDEKKKRKKQKTVINIEEDSENQQSENELEEESAEVSKLHTFKKKLIKRKSGSNTKEKEVLSQSMEESDINQIEMSKKKSKLNKKKREKRRTISKYAEEDTEKNTTDSEIDELPAESKSKKKKLKDNSDDSDNELLKHMASGSENDSKSEEEALDLDTKIDNLIEKQLKEDSSSDNDDESVTHYLDEMAEEGEEDTPSEGSNDIIDEGESVGSSEPEETDSDNTYDGDDSFIDDNDYNELLSGEEYDLAQEHKEKPKKKKRSRIIEISDSDEEKKIKSPIIDSKAKKIPTADKIEFIEAKKKLEKLKDKIEEDSDLDKMSTRPYCGLTPPSAVSVRDSLSDSDKIEVRDDEDSCSNVVINEEDNLKSLEELKQRDVVTVIENLPDIEPKVSEVNVTKGSTVFTPNNSLLTSETPQSNASARKRHSSITIQENIKLQDIKEGTVCDRIVKVIDVFCSSVQGEQKDNSGNISLNISVEYLNSPSPAQTGNDLENLKKNLTSDFSEELKTKPVEIPELKEKSKEDEELELEKSNSENKENKSSISDSKDQTTLDNEPQQKTSKKKKKKGKNLKDQQNDLPKTSKQPVCNDSDISRDLDEELHEKYFTASLEDIVQEISDSDEEPKKIKKSKKKLQEKTDSSSKKLKIVQKISNTDKELKKSKKSKIDDVQEISATDKKSKKSKIPKVVSQEQTDIPSKKLKIVQKLQDAQKDETNEPVKKTKKLKRKATSTDHEDELESEMQEAHTTKKPKKSKNKSKQNIDISTENVAEKGKKDAKEKLQPEFAQRKKDNKNTKPSFKETQSKPELYPSRIFATAVEQPHKVTYKKPKILPSTAIDEKSWSIDVIDNPLLPSSSSIKRKAEDFLVKDFKNRMLYDSSRIPRIDTIAMLKKGKKMKY